MFPISLFVYVIEQFEFWYVLGLLHLNDELILLFLFYCWIWSHYKTHNCNLLWYFLKD